MSTRAPADRIRLPPRLPYDLLVAHLGRAAGSPSERVSGDEVRVAFRGPRGPLLLRWRREGPFVRPTVRAPGRGPRADELDAGRLLLRRLLGLDQNPTPFEKHLGSTADFAELARGREGLRIPQTRDLWDGIVWVIVGQQVNLGLAYRLRNRLFERFGEPVADLVAPPSPERIAEVDPAELRPLSFSRAKAEYLCGVARKIAVGDLDVDALLSLDPPEIERRLLAVRGLGPWSVHYLMMRSLGLPDCLPAADVGLQRALEELLELPGRPDAAETRRRMEPLAPWRSLGTFHLWTRLTSPG